jgi:hypothetical protein
VYDTKEKKIVPMQRRPLAERMAGGAVDGSTFEPRAIRVDDVMKRPGNL